MNDNIVTTVCLQCGGKIEINQKTGLPTCKYCRREYRSGLGDFSHELWEISARRQRREFVQAEELCRELLRTQPDCAEGYWQMLLASHGIVYVQEGVEAKPTFFGYSYTKHDLIKNNKNYERAISLSDAEQKSYYEKNAEELDVLMQSFFELVDKQSSYDIFISFKKSEIATVGNEERAIDTADYAKACEIYEHLKDKYNVFFSPVSLGEDPGIAGEKYEPKILKALQTAQAMILVGSKTEYLEATWVENEWKRYRYFIEKGYKKKQSLVLGYTRSMPSLPTGLKDIQLPSFDMFPSGYLKELDGKLSFVKTSRGLKSLISGKVIEADFGNDSASLGYSTLERVDISTRGRREKITISPTEQRDLQTASALLSEGQYKNAERIYSNVIKRDAECAEAYWGRFLAKNRTSDLESGLTICKQQYFEDIEMAIRTADEDYAYTVIDKLIDTLSFAYDVRTKEWLLNCISKYLDDKRAATALSEISESFNSYLEANQVNDAEQLCGFCRKTLFRKDNRIKNIIFIFNYAYCLAVHKHFSIAEKYFEELLEAGVKTYANKIYWNLLCCRLKTVQPERKKFIPRLTENQKNVTDVYELELGDILAGAILNDTEGTFEDNVIDMVEWQILHNLSQAEKFIEVAVRAYRQAEKEERAETLLDRAGYISLRAGQWKLAKHCYRELLTFNAENDKAHFGLLKSKLKVIYDIEVAKKKDKLMNYDEFNNALNCASDERYKYYMELVAGRAEHSGDLSERWTAYEIGQQIGVGAFHLLPFIVAYFLVFTLSATLPLAICILVFSIIMVIVNFVLLGKRTVIDNQIRRSETFKILVHWRYIAATMLSILNAALAIFNIVYINR